jgi:hypothetical protein
VKAVEAALELEKRNPLDHQAAEGEIWWRRRHVLFLQPLGVLKDRQTDISNVVKADWAWYD